MNALTAGLVGAAFLVLIVMFLIRVRRVEREVDYAEFAKARPDDQLAYLARVVANVTVSSP
jgi:hypothetical protein